MALLLVSADVAAQSRVDVRPLPKPGAVIHVTARQEVLMRVGDKPEEPGPAYMHFKNALTFTQTNGTFSPEGKLDAQIAIERLELDESLGGAPRKGPDTSGVEGRILVVTFDRSGKLVGIKVPPDLREVSSRITQLLAGAYGIVNFLPSVELSVGEETVQTTELPMRLPGNVSQGPLAAKTTLKLRAVEKRGPDRIARLQQSIEVATATTQIQMMGGGTIDVNLDRGFVSGTETEWKISGTMQTKDSTPGPPFFGSIKINVTAN
ncbi:MAG: hypothetical protein ABIX28_25425 [Vicinamibacterales bacterium]